MKRRLKVLGIGACLVLLGAACGHSSSNNSSATTVAASSATSATTTGASGSSGSSSGSGSFGTLGQICGPGSASGSTAPGVSDTSIHVTTITDVAYAAAPGIFKDVADSASAFTAWCNAAGGIAGRKINDTLLDAKGTQDSAMMLQACSNNSLALVGDLELGDAAGVAPRLACGLAEIPGGTVSDAASDAALRVSAYPSPGSSVNVAVFAGAKHKYPNDTKVGFIYTNTPTLADVKNRELQGAQKLGFQVVYDASIPVTGLTNPQSYVLQAKAAGVQVFAPIVAAAQVAQLDQAMNTVGWYPDSVALAANVYDPSLIQAGGSSLKNTWVQYPAVPFEQANQAVTQYENIVKQYVPGGKVDAQGLRAFDAWALFAVAAKGCGNQLTRACLLQQAGSQKQWTGGGLVAPEDLNPSGQTAPVCNVAMEATPSGWKIDNSYLPATPGKEPFNCDPANVQAIG